MPEEYLALVTAMKSLTQESAVTSEPDRGLPVAEDGWNTRPDKSSYGEIQLEFEASALHGDNRKIARAYEGSMDLYSIKRNGEGWPEMIEQVLTEHCDSCWQLNNHVHENETGLFHWEWSFQVES